MKNTAVVVALGLVGFFVTLAAIIGSRLDQQVVSVLAGTACGAGVAVPLGVVIGWYVAGQRHSTPAAVPPPPPQIMVMPSAQQPSPSNLSALPPAYAAARRHFSIIGENGFNEEDSSNR